MADRSEPLAAGRVLSLARSDRAAATRALDDLSPEHQVALVCECPPQRRGEILGLLPAPEKVVPLLPEAELCFAVKAIGIADAAWLLELATPDQVVACVDLDAWTGTAPDRAALGGWIDALAETGEDALLRSSRALDPELLVLYLRDRVEVSLKPAGDEDWEPPAGGQTIDGQFYLVARNENDDLAAVLKLLGALFRRDYWTYFRMLQGAIWELDAENEEWALRWRAGRLEDLGFPSWEEAMALYGFLASERLADVPADVDALDVGAWHLPVWMPDLPVGPDARETLFRAVAQLADEERSASFYALLATANKVAVADQLPLSDAESMPRALAGAVRLVDAGLDFVARERGLEPVEVLRRVPMDRLFRVGANLEGASPRPLPTQDRNEEGPTA